LATRRVWVCASCLKGFKVQKAGGSSPAPVAEGT
jgi:hypothetical protein